MKALLTILLSWNRPELLEKTVKSYFSSISVTFDLIVVDNGSNTETTSIINSLANNYDFKTIFLEKNIGGLAFNEAIETAQLNDYRFVHFSENDIEYLTGWDQALIGKLETFKDVGQISPFSPFPPRELGDFARDKKAILTTRNDQKIYVTKSNVGSTCIVKREIIENGLRWKNIETNQGFRFPNDGLFSKEIKRLGYLIAYNDKYVVNNWGHNIYELEKDLEYYIKNHQAKSLDRLKKQLSLFDMTLIKSGEKYQIRKNKRKLK